MMRNKLTRRQFIKRLTATTLVGGGTLAAGMTLDGYRFSVSHHTFTLAKLREPLRIVQLTDLHYGLYVLEPLVKRWIEAALEQAPDIILMTGDFIDTRAKASFTPLVRQLARLQTVPLGAWGVWGNHDYHNYALTISQLTAVLHKAGVRILTNEGVLLRDDLFLAGMDDYWYGNPNSRAAFANKPEHAAGILMNHNPDMLRNLYPDSRPKADLTLCGHTHGGQICLSKGQPLSYVSREGYVGGWYDQPVPTFISRGLGFSLIPLRMNCRAEIAVIDLQPS